MLQVALLLLPLPVGSATAPQPAIVVPSAVKPTLPVGALPVTVAVKVTLAPTVEGVKEVASAVLLVALLTACDSVALVEPALACRHRRWRRCCGCPPRGSRYCR